MTPLPRNLPLGQHTDLAIHVLSGSDVEDHHDHLVIRTPMNPGFHWGNSLYVLDQARVNDAAHWLAIFEAAFPEAAHRAIGLIAPPSDATAWEATGLDVEFEDVLSTTTLPTLRPHNDGYTVRELTTDDDWSQYAAISLAQDAAEGVTVDDAHTLFVVRRAAAKRSLTTSGAAFFGAFADDVLVAKLGIVDCGDGITRYQDVLTAANHRRRGLTSLLLGVAAQWAAGQGCTTWVIVADAGSDAARLYEACGFTDKSQATQVYLAPAG